MLLYIRFPVIHTHAYLNVEDGNRYNYSKRDIDRDE